MSSEIGSQIDGHDSGDGIAGVSRMGRSPLGGALFVEERQEKVEQAIVEWDLGRKAIGSRQVEVDSCGCACSCSW